MMKRSPRAYLVVAIAVALPVFAPAQEPADDGSEFPESQNEAVTVERFQGFEIRGPIDDRWHLSRSEDAPQIANFDFAFLSQQHSFIAGVQMRGLPRAFNSHEELKAFIESQLRQSGSRGKLLSLETQVTEMHGQWALRYELRLLDQKPVNSRTPLIVQIKGYMTLHPFWQGTLIDACYSERGSETDLDGSLDSVGEELIAKVVPTKAP